MELSRIPLEGADNTRDLGGIKTLDGRKILPHRLIRSGQLFQITTLDKEILTKKYGVKVIVDLRTPMEQRQKPDPALPGVAYRFYPVLEEQTMGVTREAQSEKSLESIIRAMSVNGSEYIVSYMKGIYRSLVTDPYAQKQYKCFFEILLKQAEGAVLWHCTAGKDRAGTAAVFLLSALGVPRKTILEDYVKTNEFTRESIERAVRVAGAQTDSLQSAQAIRAILEARESYACMLFQSMEESNGSVEQYLEQALSLDHRKMERLRSMYLK